MSLVKLLGAVDGIISIKTHLKGDFGFSGILDPACFFVEEIWHEVKKVSGSILSSTSSQTLSVSPDDNDLVYLCPNLWCSNYKEFFFLAGNLFSLTFSWFLLEMHVSFVHCVAKLLHYSSFLKSKPCKSPCEKDKYVLNSLT